MPDPTAYKKSNKNVFLILAENLGVVIDILTKTQLHSDAVILAEATQIGNIQYIPRNMHTVFALLCFVVVIHWLIFPYPSGLLHWHCGNLTMAPVPAKQPWCIWIHTSCEFIMNDCVTTTKQSTTKPCAYFLGYTVLAEATQIGNRWCPTPLTSMVHLINRQSNRQF